MKCELHYKAFGIGWSVPECTNYNATLSNAPWLHFNVSVSGSGGDCSCYRMCAPWCCTNVCACVRTDVCDRQNNKALRPCDQRGEAGPRNFWPLLSKPGPDSLTRLWWDNHDSARLLFRISHMFITGVRCVWRHALKYLLRGGYKIFWNICSGVVIKYFDRTKVCKRTRRQ